MNRNAFFVLVVIGCAATSTARSQEIWYSGFLETTAGVPVSGSHDITVRLWDSEELGLTVCNPPAAATVVNDGHFRIALHAECSAAVNENTELWLEVSVAEIGDFGRIPVGAVPYARDSQRTATHVYSAEAASQSVGGVFCGETDTSYNGGRGGYAAVKTLCEAACGGSPTAHICTVDEIVRTVSTASSPVPPAFPSEGWIRGEYATTTDSLQINDCTGFTNDESGGRGFTWIGHYVTFNNCANTLPFYCCD